MRPLFMVVLLAFGALVALVAGAATFADSPRGRPAFALVDPNGGSPRLVDAQTSGFIAVSSPFIGDYCLTPANGVNVAHTAAVASQEAWYSDVVGVPTVRYEPSHTNCGPDKLEVKTWLPVPEPTPSNQIAFTVNVP